MHRSVIALVLFAAANASLVGCSAAEDAAESASQEVNATATLRFEAGAEPSLAGELAAGKPFVVEYDPARLPQCRGNLGGGHPAWNITGYYSQNGGTPKTFEPTALSADGRDRVSAPVSLELDQGGDVALWFQVHSSFGCSAYDSAFGQNYHFTARGAAPEADASLTFKADGSVAKEGALRAGGKVKVHYEQERLPDCRRVQGGLPQWSITGFAQASGEAPRTFDTGRPVGSDREAIDAIVDLPRSGELSLWFQVVSVGGCMKYDSNGGANYRFPIE